MADLFSWDAILALDEHGLNLAIEQASGRIWTRDDELFLDQGWVYIDDRGLPTYNIVPHMCTTQVWHLTMALVCRTHLSLEYGYDSGNTLGWTVSHWQHAHSLFVAEADGPEALQVALCRLALWVAGREKEAP